MMKPLHAYVSGMVLGLAKKHGLDVEPVLTPYGDYTSRFEVKSPEFPANVRIFLNIEEPLVTVSETVSVDRDELDRLDAAIDADGWTEGDSEVLC